MTLQDIMDRLVAEGYEHCHFDGPEQIIVNNRGEIELAYGEARIYDRLAPWTTHYGNHASHTDIDALFADIIATWTKEEFPCESSSTSSPSSSVEDVVETASKDASLVPVTDTEVASD